MDSIQSFFENFNSLYVNIDSKDPGSLLYRGLELLDEEPAKAHEMILESAKKGQHLAEYMIATFYISETLKVAEGEDIEEITIDWLTKAAEGGVPEAQYILGEIYLEDEFPNKSVKIAKEWFEKSAAQGYEEAIQRLVELSNEEKKEKEVEKINIKTNKRFCISCGAELEDNAKFCGECGTKQAEPTKYCSNCGVELIPNAKFCMECGTPVGNSVSNVNNSIKTETISSQPIESSDGNISVTQTDADTISIVLKGVPFNLKLVKGENYGTDKEINDFYIGETPITQALYMTVTGNNPSEDNEDINYPVTNITPALANSFLVKLKKETGVKFELPTKEQWDFAYKGGNESKGFDYSGSNDINEVGWIDKALHPVGELFPNELGLLDMEGNIAELLKGNSFTPLSSDSPKNKVKDNFKGFRIVFNYNTDGKIEGNSILQKVLASQLPKLKLDWEISIKKAEEEERKKKDDEELLKFIKDKKVRERILSYKRKKGIIVYDNWKEVEENLGFLIPDLQETTNTKYFKKGKFSIDYKKLKWKTFGELALDEDEYELAEDFDGYEGEIEYAIINGNTLILKKDEIGDDYLEFADEEWIQENVSFNYWKLNAEIEQGISNITNLIILDNKIKIHGHGFNKFKNLKNIFLNESIYSIISSHFANSKNLEKVFVSFKTHISEESFESNPKLISTDDVDKKIMKKVSKYKKQSGLIRYADYDEIKEIFPYLDKVVSKKYQEEEEKIKNIVDKQLSSSNTIWKTFGELDFDDWEDRKKSNDDNYKKNIKYTIINNSILVIKGNGRTPNFISKSEILNTINWDIKTWIINEEISEAKITSVVVLDGITVIGEYCFEELYELSVVILPQSIETISRGAFEGLKNITWINLPKNLTRIEESVFGYCRNLRGVLVPPSVEYIEDYAFGGCEKLKYLFVSDKTDIYGDALNEPERLISF